MTTPVNTFTNSVNVNATVTAKNLILNGVNNTGTSFPSAISARYADLQENITYNMSIGKEDTSLNSGYIGYHYSTTDPKMTIGLHSNNHIATFGKDNVNINKPLLVNSNQIKIENTTTDGSSLTFTDAKDAARVYYSNTRTENNYLELATANDAVEPIYVRQYKNQTNGATFYETVNQVTLLDKDGNSTFPKNLTTATLNGYNIPPTQSSTSNASINIPSLATIKSDGVMEVGKYIDFHDTNDTNDWSARLTCVKDTNGSSLNTNSTITAANVKADNETRLAAVESGKSDINHNHEISDLEGYSDVMAAIEDAASSADLVDRVDALQSELNSLKALM